MEINWTAVDVKIQILFEMVVFCQHVGLPMVSCPKSFTMSAGMIVSLMGIVGVTRISGFQWLYYACVLGKSIAHKIVQFDPEVFIPTGHRKCFLHHPSLTILWGVRTCSRVQTRGVLSVRETLKDVSSWQSRHHPNRSSVGEDEVFS